MRFIGELLALVALCSRTWAFQPPRRHAQPGSSAGRVSQGRVSQPLRAPTRLAFTAADVIGFGAGALAEAAPVAKDLTVFLLRTIIQWGVPGVVVVFLTLSFAEDFRGGDRKKERALKTYFSLGEEADGPTNPLQALLGGRGGGLQNRRSLPEFLSIERLNSRLESFEFSLQTAEMGKSFALRARRRDRLKRAFGDELALHKLNDTAIDSIANAMTELQRDAAQAKAQYTQQSAELRSLVLVEPSAAKAGFKLMKKAPKPSQRRRKLIDSISEAREAEVDAEVAFLEKITGVLPDEATKQRFARLALVSNAESLAEAFALEESDVRAAAPGGGAPRAFVLRFDGDVTASQVNALREEVTAIISNANATRGDQVVVRLNSGGGTVTGYGLAAAQLLRLKAHKIRLVVCVEQVAASGGYMMACVADHIVASPFAVLGSIGVITQIPNVYERLKKEGIEFQEITAGEFKRTLTPFKKVELKDIDKQKEDIGDIFRLFKQFVGEQRPQLDIDKIATGETWFGQDALDRKLCDELRTFDDINLDLYNRGVDVLAVRYRDPIAAGAGGLSLGSIAGGVSSLVDSQQAGGPLASKLARVLVAVLNEFGGDSAGASRRQEPMLLDTDSDRYRLE